MFFKSSKSIQGPGKSARAKIRTLCFPPLLVDKSCILVDVRFWWQPERWPIYFIAIRIFLRKGDVELSVEKRQLALTKVIGVEGREGAILTQFLDKYLILLGDVNVKENKNSETNWVFSLARKEWIEG